MDHLWLREKEVEYEVPDNRHDKGYKYLLSTKKVFVDFLRSFVRQDWAEKIEEYNIVRVDKSFILQDFKGKEADLVYWVKMNDRDILFYILLEMQSTVDFQMPYRLLLYMVEIWRGFLRDTKEEEKSKKGFRLPCIVPVVLYNGKNKWTACKRYGEYQSGYEFFANNAVDFEYILIDVNRLDDDELLKTANLIAFAFLIDKAEDFDSLLEYLKKIVKELSKFSENEFLLFKNWVINNIIKSVDFKKRNVVEKVLDESREVDKMVSNVELMLKREFKKSRDEGRKEGRIEGKMEGILELLEELGDVPKTLREKIQSQNDTAILSRWLRLAAKASSIEEFEEKM